MIFLPLKTIAVIQIHTNSPIDGSVTEPGFTLFCAVARKCRQHACVVSKRKICTVYAKRNARTYVFTRCHLGKPRSK